MAGNANDSVMSGVRAYYPAPLDTSIENVKVFRQYTDENVPICLINENLLRHHSALAEEALSRIAPGRKHFFVRGGVNGAIEYVLLKVKGLREGNTLYVRVHDLPIERAAYVFDAIKVLKITNPQPHIEGHITGYIAHNLINPNQFLEVHKVFGQLRETSKIRRVLVHQLSWNIVNRNYTPEQRAEFERALEIDGELCREIVDRIEELQQRRKIAAIWTEPEGATEDQLHQE